MRRLFAHPWGWASIAPLLCAVHCAVTPIFVVLAPTLAPSEAIEWALLGITVILAAVALASGLGRHADMRPALPIIAGLLVWGASLMHMFHPVPEEVTTIAASLTVAAGLIWNARIHCAVKAEAGHGCAVCEDETLPESQGVEPASGVRPS
ncbi:MAG: MerC domain-containing protein [Gemmatimonadales bacterium]|nr:MAG: MerC domain-containing protein [Gemmatimonadales bacterium]